MASSRDFAPWVPFDLYDFFGYLFPGVFLAISLIAFIGHCERTVLSYHQTLWTLYDQAPFVVSLGLVVGGIVVLYVLGHFIATISHIIIDRVLVDGIVGYPVTHLLRLSRESREYSEATYNYLFFSFNALLVLPVAVTAHDLLVLLTNVCLASVGVLLILRVIIMLVRSHPRKRRLARRLGDRWYFRLYLMPGKIIILPLIGFLKRLLGLDRRFPGQFIAKYKRNFKRTFELDADKVGSENYWLSFFYVSTSAPPNVSHIKTWLHLYGFSRNTSAAAYIGAALIATWMYHSPSSHDSAARIELGILIAIAWVLGIRYWILYSTYYTKNIIRSFVECTSTEGFTDKQGIDNQHKI